MCALPVPSLPLPLLEPIGMTRGRSSHSARPACTAPAAAQYGIERDFTNRTEDVVLYDLGASAAVAALVRYSAYPEGRAGKSISQLEVWAGEAWGCAKVGGREGQQRDCSGNCAHCVHYRRALIRCSLPAQRSGTWPGLRVLVAMSWRRCWWSILRR